MARALAPPVDYTTEGAPAPRRAKLAHQSRTSLSQAEQDQAQEDAFGDDPTHRRDPLQSAHVAAHKENLRRDQAAAQARSFGGRAKRVQQVAGTVSSATGGGGLRIDDASGFVLGLLVWSWVILPMLNNGPQGVRDMLRAKFVNKDANGNPIP